MDYLKKYKNNQGEELVYQLRTFHTNIFTSYTGLIK